MTISREEFKKQVRARRIDKEAAAKDPYARLREVAANYPKHFSAALVEVANKFHEAGEAMHALNENLGLVSPPKTASLAVRVAAAQKYAEDFQRITEEEPQEMGVALNDVYHAINELAGDIENLADNSGIELTPPMDEAIGEEGHLHGEFGEEAPMGEAVIEEEAPAEEVMEESPAEEIPEEAPTEEPVTAAGSNNGWVTDRDENGVPKTPKAAFLRKRNPK